MGTIANFLHNFLVSSVLDTSSGLLLWPSHTSVLAGRPRFLVASFVSGDELSLQKQKGSPTTLLTPLKTRRTLELICGDLK